MPARISAPSYYDRLDETLAEALRLWVQAVTDRRSAFHVPIVATCGADGRPRQRAMVLRAFDPVSRALRFHTDLRSMKVDDLGRDPRFSVLGYDPAAKIQIRLEGSAKLHTGDDVARSAWHGSQPMSQACYATSPAPGTSIGQGDDYALSTDAKAVAGGQAHFAALIMVFERLEWLYLFHAGHRRALFDWSDGALRQSWLVP
jgi:pyridoxamine 5'-phosphate oxidase